MNDEQIEVCRKALLIYGRDHQIRKAEEEMHELGAELDRIQDERTSEDKVVTEIADVIVMMTQLSLVFGWEKVKDEIGRKVDRLDKRLRDLLIESPKLYEGEAFGKPIDTSYEFGYFVGSRDILRRLEGKVNEEILDAIRKEIL